MSGIADKVKEKVKDAKDKVVGTADKATNTTTRSQSREYEGTSDTTVDRTKDPTQEYDEKEPMSPAKIREHEPTAVSRDPSDQKIVEPGQEGASAAEDAKEKARRSGMTKGTSGAD
jgi:hypothetical protein